MQGKTIFAAALLAGLLLGCQSGKQDSKSKAEAPSSKDSPSMAHDPHSFSQPEKALVKHLSWKAQVNFDSNYIQATANWRIETSEDADSIILDTYGLDIQEVTVDGEPAPYSLGDFQEEMGQPLRVSLSQEAQRISIRYRTTDQARALQWQDPEQTAAGKAPFLFTQSQAILARSWVPCQDSPGIRFSYDAEVEVPQGMLALMSAENPQEDNPQGNYTFQMPQPIPSYLLALAVGKLEFEALSPRAGVYAEAPLLDSAAYEFADLEKMIIAAEDLYGPYGWERYDIIVLPPSFPFGGMENPRLTFATPTILAGDRSLVSLVAHELAHSWSGNLVTNATWSDFWLNEGFTVYFEHRIMEEVYGRDYSEMLASLTRSELLEDAAQMMQENPEDTKLKLDLEGRNPDEGVTSIPYNKGYFFLRTIEEEVGRQRFDSFLRTYFEEHRFEAMTTERFLKYLQENLISQEQYAQLRLEEWVYQTGVPENIPEVPSERFAKVDSARANFLRTRELPQSKLTQNWTTHEWLHFIQKLPEDLDQGPLKKLDEAYGFTQSGNAEIVAAWFQPTIAADYQAVYPRVEEFLIQVGRRKFLTPTYDALMEHGQTDRARSIYAQARPGYHAVSRETIDEVVGYKGT